MQFNKQETNNESFANTESRRIAASALAGEMSEQESLKAIAGLIEGAGVPESVAREKHGLTDRVRTELISDLSDMMLGRATGTGGFRQSLDLKRIAAGESATGWARQLLRMGSRSKLRDIWLVENRQTLVSPLEPDYDEYRGGAAAAFHAAGTLSVDETINERRFEHTLGSLTDIKGLRANAQTRQEAAHLRFAYRIANPIVVPEDPESREWVADVLETNPMAAYQSLVEWLMRIGTLERPKTKERPVGLDMDKRLVGLWDEFQSEEAYAIYEHRPAFAHKLALAAALKLPKPSRDTIKEAVSIVEMAASGHGWELHAAELVNSWIAVECASESEFRSKTKSAAAEAEARQAHVDAAAAWPTLATETVLWHNAPLGSSKEAVAKFISRVFTSVDPANFPQM